MEFLKELEQIENSIKQKKENASLTKINNEIDLQYEQHLTELKDSDDFKKLTQEITERKARAKIGSDMLEVMNEEHINALSLYVLDLKKAELDYRQKKEKKVIIKETKAKIEEKRINALKIRYGYLYKQNEEFVPNKLHNKLKEVSNWWNSTSDNFRKLVKGGLKIIGWGVFALLIIYFGYKGVVWLMQNVNIPT